MSVDERQQIEAWLRAGKTPQRVAQRAAAIVPAEQGMHKQESAAAGAGRLPPSGRPPVFPPQARHVGARVACQEDRERGFPEFSHSSVRDLARWVAGHGASMTMSPPTVQRILAEMGLKPPRVRSIAQVPAPG